VPRAVPADAPPDGLRFEEDVLGEEEERTIVAVLEGVDFRDVTMRGQTARRTVRHFGLDYDYESYRLTPADPLPAALGPVRDRCADLAAVAPEALAQILVTRYPPGATIGWHRDAPMFGLVVGVSLLAACRLRLQRGQGEERRVFDLALPPRSAYVLDGPARTAWQHSIPAVPSLRYSITFRTLRNPERWTSGTGRGAPAAP
jgi:alkylated DNA repair dioxygenase AlkB